MNSRCTFLPSGPVCGVTRVIPKIFLIAASASALVFATFTPPPLPRPPAWICALTTTTSVPARFCTSGTAASASSTENAGTPIGTGTPYFLSSSLPWYSWIFMGGRVISAPAMIKRPKIAIVGAGGNVGAAVAQWAVLKELGELVLIDIKPQPAEGRALDLTQAGAWEGFNNTRFTATDKAEAMKGADVVVMTAGEIGRAHV